MREACRTDLKEYSAFSLRCENRKERRRLGEWPLGYCVSERKVFHTEVRRLYACKEVLSKFVAQ
jgi:hypothetical protein